MADNEFNMDVNEVQIKTQQWMGKIKEEIKNTSCTWSGFDTFQVFIRLHKSKLCLPEAPVFVKLTAEGECQQVDPELTLTEVIPSWLQLGGSHLMIRD